MHINEVGTWEIVPWEAVIVKMPNTPIRYRKSQIYEYIARVFYNVVLYIYDQMPRKNEFNVNVQFQGY